MNVFDFVEIEVFTFLLILARMSSFLVAWPLLGSASVPPVIKILFSLLLSLVIFPVVKSTFSSDIATWQELMFRVGREVIIGLSLAFVSSLFFFAVSIGSDLIGMGMGISAGKVFNPSLQIPMTGIDNFYYIFAGLLFLLLNFHHVFLTGLIRSYDILPASGWGFELGSFSQIALFGKEILIIGLQLAAPVLVSILLINISLAIVGRAVPQINVLITSLPLNILVGLLILVASVPFLLAHMRETMGDFAEVFFGFLKTI